MTANNVCRVRLRSHKQSFDQECFKGYQMISKQSSKSPPHRISIHNTMDGPRTIAAIKIYKACNRPAVFGREISHDSHRQKRNENLAMTSITLYNLGASLRATHSNTLPERYGDIWRRFQTAHPVQVNDIKRYSFSARAPSVNSMVILFFAFVARLLICACPVCEFQ